MFSFIMSNSKSFFFENNEIYFFRGLSWCCVSLQLSAVPQESRTLTSTVPEGAELQAECLLVREVKCVCVCVCT